MKTTRLFGTIFFLSGISGLIYQVVWFRRLALIFGVTSYALGTVLAAFIAGLAIGSVAGGWLADRRAQPLRLYGLTEMAIAACGLAVLPLIDVVQQLYLSLAPHVIEQPAALHALRFGLSFVVMIPATACMGATLPLGVRAVDSRQSTAMSRLYAANTAGAMLGVLVGSFVLLGVFGLSTTTRIAAVVNVLCGVAALLLVRSQPKENPALGLAAEWKASGTPHVETRLTTAQKGVLAALIASGFAGLAFELIWTRLFAVLAFDVVYGYAIMLAVLLGGITVGSAWYGRVLSDSDAAVGHLIWLELGIGCVAAVSSLWLLPLGDGSIAAGALHWLGVGDLVRRCPGCVSILPGPLVVVFVSSALSGATIPAATRVFAGAGPMWATRLGIGYGGNLVGGALGSVVAGFWLLPALGAHAAILTIATMNVVVAAALAFVTARRFLGVAALVIGGVALAPASLDATRLDVFRTVLAARLSTAKILWCEEGLESSVAVAQTNNDQFLLINGAIHSASTGLYYHRWLGHLGAFVHSNPREALVIGLGGGATAGALALHAGIRVHVVELSSGVLSAAEHVLADDNYGLFSRPGVTREVDDGRNHLLVSGRTYDIIEADIVEPRHAGASILYSREFFQSARRALRPGGIMVQWLGGAKSDAGKWTLNTFRSVFPYVTLWVGGDVAIGSNDQQAPLDWSRLERLFDDAVMKKALTDAGLGSVDRILALRAVGPNTGVGGPIITDDRPVLEYFLTLPFMTRLAFGQR